MQKAKNKKDYSVIIMAAGKSERMGFPKLSLKFNERFTFIEHIINEYKNIGCKEITIIVNKTGRKYIHENGIKIPSTVKIVINEHPEWHRFYSLKIGAKNLENFYPAFIHNVDNPFVNQEILMQLIDSSDKADYISPEYEGQGGHPFLISAKIIQDLKDSESDQIHLKEFLNLYTRLRVPVTDEKILVNINTLEDYREFFSYEF